MADAEFDEAVQTVLRAFAVPQRPEPRVADALTAVEQQRVAGPDGALAAWRIGTGPAVLLVHGWADNNSLWAPLVDALVARSRAVVAFDLPAHGLSAGEWGLGPQMHAGTLAVGAALGPIDAVVAHSFACAIATQAMHEGLHAERAVFVAPILREADRWHIYQERLGASDEVIAAAKALYEQRVGPEYAALSFRQLLTTLEPELLVVASRDDERSPFDETEAVLASYPRARLEAVDGPTHRRTARDPQVVALVADYVTA